MLSGALCIASLTTCRGEPSAVVSVHLEVTPGAVEIAQNDSAQLTVSALDDHGLLVTGISVRFTTADSRLLAVTPLGWVRALGPAGATVVSVSGAGSHVDVPVNIRGVPNRITISPNPLVVAQKATVQLQTDIVDLNGDPIAGAPLIFTPSNITLFTVSSEGRVTSVGPAGSGSLSVTSGSLAAQTAVTIVQVPGSISVPASVSLGINQSMTLGAQVLDLVGLPMPNATITYQSNDVSRIQVSSAGLVTSVGPVGSSTVTIRSGDLSQVVTVTVAAVGHPLGNLTHVNLTGGAYGTAASASAVWVAALSGVIYRITLATFAVTQMASLNGQATDLAMSPDGANVYVAGPATAVTRLSATTGAVTATIDPGIGTVFDVAADQSLTPVYAAGANSIVAFLNPGPSNQVAGRATVPGGFPLGHVAKHPFEPLLYASTINSGGRVSEINAVSRTVIRTFLFSGTMQGLAVSPDGAELYAANESNGTLQIVALATGIVVPLSLPSCTPHGVVVTPDGEQIYISCIGSFGTTAGKVLVMDRVSRAVTQTIATGGDPRRLSISADGFVLAVANQSGWVDIIR